MNQPLTRHPFAGDLREMSRLMNRWFRNDGFQRLFDFDDDVEVALTDWSPCVDIEETDAAWLIKAEIPQVKKEDVKIAIENGRLTLAGERRQETEDKGKRFHRTERTYGKFTRTFLLPDDVDQTKIDAAFADGMLNITLPKTETSKPRAQEIKVH